MSQKRIVHLRVYKGKELNFDENRKVRNENHLIKSREDSNEFKSVLQFLPNNNYCKVEVEKVFTVSVDEKTGKESYQETDGNDIKEVVQKAFSNKPKAELTSEQKRIAELEAKIEALSNGKTQPKKEVVSEGEKQLEDYSMNELKEMYPNIADLGIRKKPDFIEKVRELES